MAFSSILVVVATFQIANVELVQFPDFVQDYLAQSDLAYEIPRGNFSSEALENIRLGNLSNPWWILADLNGDGRDDWAGFLRSENGRLDLVAVYSLRKFYRHQVLTSPGTDSDEIGFGVILEAPGKIEGFPINEELPAPEILLEYPGIHLIWFEKASSLFYWKGGSFQAFLTGD